MMAKSIMATRVNDGHEVDFDNQSKTFTYTYDLRREVTNLSTDNNSINEPDRWESNQHS